ARARGDADGGRAVAGRRDVPGGIDRGHRGVVAGVLCRARHVPVAVGDDELPAVVGVLELDRGDGAGQRRRGGGRDGREDGEDGGQRTQGIPRDGAWRGIWECVHGVLSVGGGRQAGESAVYAGGAQHLQNIPDAGR